MKALTFIALALGSAAAVGAIALVVINRDRLFRRPLEKDPIQTWENEGGAPAPIFIPSTNSQSHA